MSTTAETGEVTGTKDKDYNLIWYTEKCLDNALRLETYVKDAERDGDNEVAELFRKARLTAARAPRPRSSSWPSVSERRAACDTTALPAGSGSTTQRKCHRSCAGRFPSRPRRRAARPRRAHRRRGNRRHPVLAGPGIGHSVKAKPRAFGRSASWRSTRRG